MPTSYNTLLAQFDEAIKQAPEWTDAGGPIGRHELRLRLADGTELYCKAWPSPWRGHGAWAANVLLFDADGNALNEINGHGQTKADAFRSAVRMMGAR